MKQLALLILALILSISIFSQKTIKKEGNQLLIGSQYYNTALLKFYYSDVRIYVYDGTSFQHELIGTYDEFQTSGGATFETPDAVVDYLASLCVETSYNYELAFGYLTDQLSYYKFGRNPAVGITEEVIWDGGGEYVFLDSAQYIKISSLSDDDSLGGANAWAVYLEGLDSLFNIQSEIISLHGIDSVVSAKKYRRVFRSFVTMAGTTTTTNGNNIGDISFTSDDSKNLVAKILAGNGQTLMSVFTIPAGYTGYITGYALGAGQGKAVLFKSKFRNCAIANCAFTVKDIREIYQSTFLGDLKTPLAVPEYTDMVIVGQNLLANDVSCSASFGIILKKN